MENCLDLVFTVDCTASMGSYIREAQRTIGKIVSEISSTSQFKVRFGLVEYRDHGRRTSNGFVTRKNGFTSSLTVMQGWLNNMNAHTGDTSCDVPEAVTDGLVDTLRLWTSSASGASVKDARVCVLISDAPPHGLNDYYDDNYPNGCPCGNDPLEIANQLAENGVTIYAVGCEPSVSPHRDFFMAIAKITGGLYIPLGSSDSLSKVIVGVSREEISLRELMETVEHEVKEEYSKNKGIVDEETVSKSLFEKFKGRKIKQLQMDGNALPKISARAKRFARFDNITNVKKKFVCGPSDRTYVGNNPKFVVADKEIEIGQVQRMVQKAIMINHLGE